MTTTTALGADKATDERALFLAYWKACYQYSDAHRFVDDNGLWCTPSDDPVHIGWSTWKAARASRAAVPASEPVNMILHCPKCGLQHIDASDERTADWTNPPHKSHLCHGCGHIWRPADVPTNGVAAIATKGSADSPAAAPAPVSGMPDLASLLEELRDEYRSVVNSAYCQCDSDDDLLGRVSAALTTDTPNPTGETK